MAMNLNSFSGNNFRGTIQQYCYQLGWRISSISDKQAVIKFNMDSGVVQTLYIIKFDTTLEFSVPSALRFNSKNVIPGEISTALLAVNSTYTVGFWSLENIGGKETLSIMHNAEMTLIDVEYFRRVVIHLVTECERLEQAIRNSLDGQ